MEQLSSSAIRQLLQTARESAGGAAPGLQKVQPWAKRESYEMGRPEPILGSHAALAPRMGSGQVAPGGIERRLVRRAETMWLGMKPEGELPVASAALQFVAAAMAGQALLLSLPEGGDPELLFAGEAISALARIEPGLARADSRSNATLAERLVALAVRAVATGAPALMDSDGEADAGGRGRAHLLLRAIALPFRPDNAADGAPAAVVVASWRKLLSARETAALHRELAAAIDWMHGSMEGGAGR
ncbi:hypothetical protein [Sandaracinobacteroides hominis]|uniref:hypothetical protein n=1 Tax=Sandaracinobacteroides hominis TaxID=2780086 RepID=UPI0018F2AF9D|nr:hypothetical protein [Sandaracinobacteroides hominis]